MRLGAMGSRGGFGSSGVLGTVNGINPGTVSGLLRWYSASNITGVADGAGIASWPDASSNADTATQGTGANQPTYVQSGFNGKPVARFNGSSSFEAFTAVSTIRTAIFVLKATASGFPDFAPLLGHATLFDWGGAIGVDTKAIDDFGGALAAILRGGLRVNGVAAGAGALFPRPTNMSIVSITTTGNVNAQYLTNDRNTSPRCWKGDYATVLLYNRVLTTTELAGIETWLSHFYGIAIGAPPFATPLTANIVAQGDSLTFGTNATNTRTKSYPRQMIEGMTGSDAAYMLTNIGVGGQLASTIDSTTYAQDGAIRFNPLISKNVYLEWSGTNDLRNSVTPASVYTTRKSIWAKARASGFKVVVLTTLPRGDATSIAANFETNRQTLNSLVLSDTSLYDGIYDVGSNATIGVAGAYNNATYYNQTDLTHLTDAGYAIVASGTGPVVAALL